jgi:hypothetical protein
MAGTNISTAISIGGQLQGSFGSMIRQSKLGLLSLQTQAVKTNAILTGIGKTMLGFAGGFLAFEGIKNFLSESIKLSKEEGATEGALLATLIAQNRARGLAPGFAKEQLEAIKRTSKALQEQSGISKELFMDNAKQLNMFKLSTAQIQRMLPALADLTAYQKKAGIETSGNAAAIGKFLATGQAKGLRSVGIELNQMQATVAKHLSVTQRLSMVYAEIERQYGGLAAKRGKDLVGQADLAAIHWHETMKKIGDSFLPVQRKLTLFFGEIASIIGPPLIKLSQFIAQNFDSWTAIIRKSVIPVIRDLVTKGWKLLTGAITFFQQNSSWLIPWMGNVVKAIGLWVFAIQPLLQGIALVRTALMGLALLNPWTALAAAAIAAGVLVIQHWTQVKKFLGGIYEMIVGTKVYNASLEDKGVLRAFKKGEVPKAQPVQLGWVGTIQKAWKDFTSGMPQDVKDALANIQKQWGILTANIQSAWQANVAPWLVPVWNEVIKLLGDIRNIWIQGFILGVESVIIGVSKLLTVVNNISQGFHDAYDWFKKLGDARPDLQQPGVPRVRIGWAESVVGFFKDDLPKLWGGVTDMLKGAWDAGGILVKWAQDIGGWITNQLPKWGTSVGDWFHSLWTGLTNWMTPNVWSPMQTGVKGVGDAMKTYLINPMTTIKDQWDAFLASLNPAGSTGAGAGGGGGGNGFKGGQIWNPLGPAPSALVRAENYGPAVGDRPTAAVTRGPLGWLRPGDIAVSPDLSKAFPLKSYVDVFDKATHKLLLAHQRVADSSWVDAQHPNHMTIETWNRRLKADQVIIKRSPQIPLAPTREGASRDVHINYTVTNHIHGGEDLERRMATIHHRHLERMKEDLAESTASMRRRSFVNADI